MNEVEQILDKNSRSYRCLAQWAGVAELYHVSIFKGYRQSQRGEIHPVTIEIWDAGPNPEMPNAARPSDHRYFVKAKDEATGATATGKPAPTVEQALDITNWAELDLEQ